MLFSYHTTAADFHPRLCHFFSHFFCFHFSLAKNAIPMYSILYINFRNLCFRKYKGV